ncbi:MAG: hypothetical protein QHH75_14625 [Bacillota bacterium]|nr:hypothetical protein [Bacillota bacterium]
MKKLTVFFVILVIPLIFTGCQKYDPVGTLQATISLRWSIMKRQKEIL